MLMRNQGDDAALVSNTVCGIMVVDIDGETLCEMGSWLGRLLVSSSLLLNFVKSRTVCFRYTVALVCTCTTCSPRKIR